MAKILTIVCKLRVTGPEWESITTLPWEHFALTEKVYFGICGVWMKSQMARFGQWGVIASWKVNPGSRWKPDEYFVRWEGQVDSFYVDGLGKLPGGGRNGLCGKREGEGMCERTCLPFLERIRGSTELGSQLLVAPQPPWFPDFEHSFTAGLMGSLTSLTISTPVPCLSSHVF